MTGLVVVTALRSEYVAIAGQVRGARTVRCGMGPDRVRAWSQRLAELGPDVLVVAGVSGGLDPSLRSGDIVVANEVRDEHGRTELRGAAPLVAELRRMGMTVHTGPTVSCDHIVTSPAERAQLAATGAVAVDMESAAVLRAAPDVPRAVVRVIVDSATGAFARPATLAAGVRALRTLRALAPAVSRWAEAIGPRRVVLAGPRSFCAGVERAIDIVDGALQSYPHPVYVRRQIVHNSHVVSDLARRGAVFVDELDQVPDGTTVVFSAHGVPPAVRREAERRDLTVIDATCPLVAKVHSEARRFAGRGDTVLLIGHAGHDETEGTLGEEPNRIKLVQNAAEAELVEVEDETKVAMLMQTTLAAHEAALPGDVLRRRFPMIETSATDDICYATTNRQLAVGAIADESDVVLVVGSRNSSNSLRLVEVAERRGVPGYLVDDASEILPEWLVGAGTVGITAGASAPPHLVDEVIGTLRALGPVDIDERVVVREDVTFMLPKGLPKRLPKGVVG